MLIMLLVSSLLAAPESQVRDGGFELGRGWVVNQGAFVARDGGLCLRFQGAGSASQELPAATPGPYTVAVDIRTRDVQPAGGAGYAFAAVYQLDARGELLEFRDFAQLTGDHDWQRLSYTFQPHPAAAILSLRCGLFNAGGEASFDNWTLVAGPQPALFAEVTERGIRSGSSGRAGVLRVPDLPVHGAPADPEALANLLRQAGYEIDFLSDVQLADPDQLRADRYDLIALPYGESFPGAARAAFTNYLRGGGSFLSVGGYAFQRLLYRDGDGWIDDAERVGRANVVALDPAHSPLPDPGFETTTQPIEGGETLDGRWHRNHELARIVSEGYHSGRRCVRIDSAAHETIEERKVWLDLPAEPGSLRVQGWLRTQDVHRDGFAYVAWYQYDADGKLLAWKDFAQVRGTTDWTSYHDDFAIQPGATRLHLKAGLYRTSGTAWLDDLAIGPVALATPMNTSNGKPADGLETTPQQIGVFDPSVPLQRVSSLTAGEETVETPARGWVAVGVLGNDNARWLPVLTARDRYGRPRGAAMAMVLNHAGYYAGSVWGFCGVDDRDLFADPASPASTAFKQAAQRIRRGVWLKGLGTDRRLYRDGEPVGVEVDLFGLGPLPDDTTVQFVVKPTSGDGAAYEATVEAGRSAAATFNLASFSAPLYEVTAKLVIEGQAVDTITSGFAVDRPNVARSGPALRWTDNGFTLNGRPLFLFGSDTYSYTYQSGHDNPLTWAADHQAARDIGLDLYENLQYNNPDHAMTAADWRAFRAMAQSTQAHGLVFMPGMLIGHDVIADDAELARQSAVCAGYAELLHDLPGLLYYINGDYQLRPDRHRETVTALWNRWLLERYGHRAGIAAAWDGAQLPDGELPYPPKVSRRWDDPVAVDRADFLTWLMTRWNEAHVAAVRQHDTAHPITSEYYRKPFDGMDLRLTIAGQDVSNIGYFGEPEDDLDDLAKVLRWNDLRARGKGIALGEYGVKTHPAWAVSNGGRGYHIVRTMEQASQLVLTVGSITLGAGGSKIQNWCLRDSQTRVFPWGLFIPNQLVAKDYAYTHRNLSALFRLLAPVDEAPPLTVCLPSRMRQGNDPQLGVELGYQCFEALFGLHTAFNVVDDTGLGDLPATTQALILPSPFAMSDEAFDRLTAWVRKGGKLLVTGDLSCDERRRETNAGRLATLCGVRRGESLTGSLGGPSQPVKPWYKVEPAGAIVLYAADGIPGGTLFQLGQGTVWYAPGPLQAGPDDEAVGRLRGVLAAFLRYTGLEALPVMPDDPELRLFTRPTASGRVYVAMHHAHREGRYQAKVTTPAGDLSLGARYRWPSLAQLDREGRVRLVMVDGQASLAGRTFLTATGLQGAAALDGAALASSRQLLVAPFDTGEVLLPARPGQFVALIGEVLNGAWQPYERLPLSGGDLRIPIDEDRRCTVILFCEAGREAETIAQAEQLMIRPWDRPGF